MYTCQIPSLTQEDKNRLDKMLPLAYGRDKRDRDTMRCPGCKRNTLKRGDTAVSCTFCGYTLTPGEEARYRLYELLG